MFALIIGINKYKNSPHIPNLDGAVPDADDVLDYLQNHLGVPSSQITILLDSKATRAAIIDEIKAFSLDDRIKEGDPILIYYAGHGHSAVTPKTKDWESWSTDKIELLVPYDYSSVKDDIKHGILDRTLEALLSDLAKLKGNNIVRQTFILRGLIYQLTTRQTVILDCLHSGSGTQNLLDPTLQTRYESLTFADEYILCHIVSYLPAETLKNLNTVHRVFFDAWMKSRYESLTFAKNDKQLLDRLKR
jgi:Caspase domain